MERVPGYYLVAVSGPEAGSWWRLPDTGRFIVGRGSDCNAQIADGLVSTRHLAVAVASPGSIVVEDLGSSNGTTLENTVLESPTEVPLGAYVQVGSTVLTILEVTDADLPVEAAPVEGARPFQRHYREALTPLPKKLLPPDEPTDRENESQRMWWQYLLPMATGIGFALMTGRWIFLLIMAVSPIAMLINFFVKRRKSATSKAEERRDYEARLAQYQVDLERIHALERDRRRRSAVVGGEAVLMSEFRHRRLWERSGDDDDYLEVCVGLANQPSQVQTTTDDERRSLWAVPLSVPLGETGSLLVRGRMDRARAVGRSMLLNLAATHSPAGMQISVLTTEANEEDWNWARWLPHTFVDGGATQIHTTHDQRAAAMNAISRQIEAREDGAAGPVHVVVIDGAEHVDGGRLTTILSRSVELGIHGIVLDAHVTPEGVGGTLSLGDHPDEGTFVSRQMARVDGILTAELAVGWAERAAQVMAGLRPSAAEAEGLDAPEVHLTDLLGAGASLDADWVRARWASTSPTEQVVVGLAGRTPVEMDVVRHGPHAIVGGATRSGKTEFLLTWLTAMCLNNTPDDLAIIVADFKGGVDHVQTAKLPHVISLVTNQDIRAFERTMVMLEAEIER
ncbi:MAG: FtsK/SpoIIIE domain-containing protein, partial [Nitriliruptoraceae bacterium]